MLYWVEHDQIRATLTMDGQFYFLSLVDWNDRNQAQTCRRM